MENIKDSERYYKSFLQELDDYNDMESIEFYGKYIDTKWEDICMDEWENLGEDQNRFEDYEEFKEEYIEDNFDYEKLSQSIYEYFSPLDITTYVNESNEDEKIYKIQVTRGGPNIYVTIDNKYSEGEYEFYWGGDQFSTKLDSHYLSLYMSILNLDYNY